VARWAELEERAREALEQRAERLPAARTLRHELTLERVERFAGHRPLRLLDAGCGDGLLCVLIARRHPGWEVVGADQDDALLEKGRARAEKHGVKNVHFVRADLTQQLGSGLYDAVLAVECLVEIPDDAAVLDRMASALRPGGLLLAHVPEKDWRPVLPGGARSWRLEVRHGYSDADLRLLLERAGLEAIRISQTAYTLVWAANDLADRLKRASLKARSLAYPPSAAAVRLERWGLRWGAPHALLAEARRPA
jgi:SAM-dependent methyltransferase